MYKGSFNNKLTGFKSKPLFPPPQFLSLYHCGIDISQGVARFIRFDDSNQGVRIKVFGEVPISRFDTSPEKTFTEADKNTLITVLNKIGSGFVRVVVPEDEVYIFRMRAPRVHDGELRNVIDFKLEENIPIRRTDAVFEYDIISVLENEYILSVSAVPNEYIMKVTNVLEGAGFTPIVFDTEARSLARALSSTNEVELAVAFNEYYTSFVIIQDGVPLFSSTAPIGVYDMVKAIMKNYNMSEAEAIKLKKEKLFGQSAEDPKFFSAVTGSMLSIKDEINKVLSYWGSQGKKEGLPDISRIVLVGENVAFGSALKYLSENIKIPMSLGNVWVNVFSLDTHVPEMSRESSLSYASLVGISLI